MPSKKQYDLVTNDEYDTRIPLHPDEAFHHGITFQAKYIGTLDVPRPTSRAEIVAAMRRIRYDFKARGLKKKKVTVEVSVQGVRVLLRKKKKKKQWINEKDSVLMQHPIYRIFYVSHDSQDLKIFSYIARDGSTNVFKCSVFKSNKKSQAMRVVRTVGQAFEVCHKLSINSPNTQDDEQESEKNSDSINKHQHDSYEGLETGNNDSTSTLHAQSDTSTVPQRPLRLEILPSPPNTTKKKSNLTGEMYSSPISGEPLKMDSITGSECGQELPNSGTPLSAHHEVQLLREQLEQQCQQTQAAIAQIHLLRDQLAAETAARIDSQARIQQLFVQNKELIDHIACLVQQLQDHERLQGNFPIPSVPQTPTSFQTMYLPDLSSLAIENRGFGSQFIPVTGTSPWSNALYTDPLLQRLRATSSLYSSIYSSSASSQFRHPSSLSLSNSPMMVHRAQSEPTDDQFIRPFSSYSMGIKVPSTPPPSQNYSAKDNTLTMNSGMAALNLAGGSLKKTGPPFIQRSTSEKVPNKSELMSQVQRTQWARHTTK